jgi:hypothetical protein
MWKFKQLVSGEPERDPRESEFFHITNLSEAIVREVIQNSLDAKESNIDSIKIHFTLGKSTKKNVEHYFTGLDQHLQACDLLPSDYRECTHVPFITIEDFNTTGLDGIIWESEKRPVGRSNFYNFWWCEGKSLKGGKEGGRWGLGKTTFHIASKSRSFMGLTVRIDDKRELLMGKALLRTHRINDIPYNYYGYFVADGFRPIENATALNRFKQCFSIKRNKEPGFSLVIPMPQDEINFSSIVRSAIIHYSFAIMKNILSIEVDDYLSKNHLLLNSSNLLNVAQRQDWRGTSWENRNVIEMLGFMNSSVNAQQIVELPCTNLEDITESSLGSRLEELRNSFAKENLLGFKIPIMIWRKGESHIDSYFYIFVKKYSHLKRSEEFYFRSGITIPEVRPTLRNRPVRAMLVAEDSQIATFLGDSETPAHTDWNERTELFNEKYEYASRTLRSIKKSMSNIVTCLDIPTSDIQRDFLKEIFYVEEIEPENGKQGTKRQKIKIEKTKPSPFEMFQIRGGFKVSLKEKDVKLPIQAIIKVAYDTRRGNPFNKYDTNDFVLDDNSITIKSFGCTNIKAKRNEIETTVERENFELIVTGFDANRDLKVDVKEKQSETNV